MFECSICFNEDIPFVILREKIYGIQAKPLDFFYNKIVCGSCAQLFCNRKRDPVHVKCFAAFPVVKFNNKKSVKLFVEKFRETMIVWEVNERPDEGVDEGADERVDERVPWFMNALTDNLPNELKDIMKQFY